MPDLESYRRARTELQQTIESYRRSITLTQLISYRRARTELVTAIDSYRRSMTGLWPVAFYNSFISNTTSPITPSKVASSLVYSITVIIGGSDVSQYVELFEFTESLGQKAEARLILADKDSNGLLVRPGRFGPDGGTIAVHPHNMTDDIKVTVTIDASGVTSLYPTFLIDDVDFDPDGVCTLSLVDFHSLLEQDGINDTDIQNEAGTGVSANTAITQMATDAGLSVTVETVDYPINELRRTLGSRLGWIQRIMTPYQAYTQFFGDTLYIKAPRYGGSGNDFSLTDYQNLTNLSFRETTAGHKNRFRCSRLQPGASRIIGEARGDTYGRNSQTQAIIDPPSRVVIAYIDKVEKGALIDFVFFDASDTPIHDSANAGVYVGAQPCARVEFTFYPQAFALDLSIIKAEFHVYFTGSVGMPAEEDELFYDVANMTQEQTYYGVREEYDILEDPIWPNKAMATTAANNLALENADQRIISNWSTWLNPRVRVGYRVAITDWTMRQVSSSWLVRQVFHHYSPISAYMTIGCTRRR